MNPTPTTPNAPISDGQQQQQRTPTPTLPLLTFVPPEEIVKVEPADVSDILQEAPSDGQPTPISERRNDLSGPSSSEQVGDEMSPQTREQTPVASGLVQELQRKMDQQSEQGDALRSKMVLLIENQTEYADRELAYKQEIDALQSKLGRVVGIQDMDTQLEEPHMELTQASTQMDVDETRSEDGSVQLSIQFGEGTHVSVVEAQNRELLAQVASLNAQLADVQSRFDITATDFDQRMSEMVSEADLMSDRLQFGHEESEDLKRRVRELEDASAQQVIEKASALQELVSSREVVARLKGRHDDLAREARAEHAAKDERLALFMNQEAELLEERDRLRIADNSHIARIAALEASHQKYSTSQQAEIVQLKEALAIGNKKWLALQARPSTPPSSKDNASHERILILTRDLAKVAEERDRLRTSKSLKVAQISALEAAHAKLNLTVGARAAECDALKIKLEESAARIAVSAAEHAAHRTVLEQNKRLADGQASEIKAATRLVAQLEEDKSRISAESEAWRERSLQVANEAAREVSELKARFNTDLFNGKEEIKILAEKLMTADAQTRESEATRETLEASLHRQRTEIASIIEEKTARIEAVERELASQTEQLRLAESSWTVEQTADRNLVKSLTIELDAARLSRDEGCAKRVKLGAEHDAALKQLKDDLDSRREALSAAEDRANGEQTQLKAAISRLQADFDQQTLSHEGALQARSLELLSLQSLCDEVSISRQALEADVASREAQIAELQASNEQTALQSTENSEKLQDLEMTLARERADAAAASASQIMVRETLESRLRELEVDLGTARAEGKAMLDLEQERASCALAAHELVVSGLKSQVTGAESREQDLLTQLQETRELLTTHDAARAALEKRLCQAETDRDAMRDQSEAMREQKELAAGAHEIVVSELNEKINEFKARVEDLTEQLAAMSQKADKQEAIAQDALHRTQVITASREEAIRKSNEATTVHLEAVERLEGTLQKQATRIGELDREIVDQRQRASDAAAALEGQVEDWKSKELQALDRLTEAESELVQAQNRAKSQLRAHNEEIEVLEAKVHVAAGRVSELEVQLSAGEHKAAEDLRTHKAVVLSLNDDLAHAKSEVADKTQDLANLRQIQAELEISAEERQTVLTGVLASLETERLKWETAQTEHETAIAQLQRDNNGKADQIALLRLETGRCGEEITTLTADVEDRNDKIAIIQKRFDEAQDAATTSKMRIEQLEADHNDIKTKYDVSLRDLQETLAALKQQTALAESWKEKCDAVRIEHEAAANEATEVLQGTQTQLEDAIDAKNRLAVRLAAAEQDRETVEFNVVQLKEHLLLEKEERVGAERALKVNREELVVAQRSVGELSNSAQKTAEEHLEALSNLKLAHAAELSEEHRKLQHALLATKSAETALSVLQSEKASARDVDRARIAELEQSAADMADVHASELTAFKEAYRADVERAAMENETLQETIYDAHAETMSLTAERDAAVAKLKAFQAAETVENQQVSPSAPPAPGSGKRTRKDGNHLALIPEPSPKRQRSTAPDFMTPMPIEKNRGSTTSSGRSTAQSVDSRKLVFALSGFKEGTAFDQSLKKKIIKLAKSLGATIMPNLKDWNSAITHLVSPSSSRTLKTFAAALTHAWIIVDPSWIHLSEQRGAWQDEMPYGFLSKATPFKDVKFYMAPSFKEAKDYHYDYARCLLLNGRATLVDSAEEAEVVLKDTADRTAFPTDSMDWNAFANKIPQPTIGHPQAASVAPRSSIGVTPSPKTRPAGKLRD
ncbi:hypothetical protein HKX48_007346 [Thoreauomyces humboldtii]|nr:hypothetical protein HKX48_007346 [Thoreauomyces humboldtii]